MARKRPYTKKLLIVDIILCVVTQFAWVIVMAFRELYMFNSK